MPKRRACKSDAFAAIHETAAGLRAAGAISERTVPDAD
jgi:DNA-binding transcriptional regulator YiaG